MVNWVHGIVELELEVFSQFLANSSRHGCQDILENAEIGGIVLIVVTTLKDTRPYKARVPSIKVTPNDILS